MTWLIIAAANTASPLVTYAALAISLLTLTVAVREFTHRVKVDYVAGLEKRLEDCEADRKVLHSKCDDLEDENMKLMRRVIVLEQA